MISYLLSVLLFLVTAWAVVFGAMCAWVLVLRALTAHRRGMARLAALDPCPVCGARYGWHDQRCGVLDRLDARRAR